MQGSLITSVGTEIGKTLVTAILCHQLASAGRVVRAVKPIVSGYSPVDPTSDPVLILKSLGQIPSERSIAAMCPWRFTAPLSPHLAARIDGRSTNFDEVTSFCRDQECGDEGHLLIEGAGGVMSPINDTHTVLDLAASLAHPVVLVTGSYLGAMSHTLTALSAIHGRGLVVAGIVVSQSEIDAGMAATVDTLRQFADPKVPLLALPRLVGTDEEKWRAAPCLLALVGAGDASLHGKTPAD